MKDEKETAVQRMRPINKGELKYSINDLVAGRVTTITLLSGREQRELVLTFTPTFCIDVEYLGQLEDGTPALLRLFGSPVRLFVPEGRHESLLAKTT